MKNKGFTLLEIIGVIVILSVVALLTVPALTKTFRSSADKQYEDYIKDIQIAAESYFHEQTDGNLDSSYIITVGELIQKDYYKKRVNPKTNKKTAEDTTITITKNADGTENYEVTESKFSTNDYIQDGLIVHYDSYIKPIDNIWRDISGNGNNGILNNFNLNDINGGLTFASNSYVLIGEKNDSEMTLEVVTKSFNNDVNEQYIVSNVNVGGYGITTNKDKRFASCLYNGSWQCIYINNNELNRNYYLAQRFNSTTQTLNVNDQKQTSSLSSAVTPPTNNTNLVIGCNPGGIKCDTQSYNGIVYSVRLYNRYLTDDEIAHNYEIDKYRFGV